MQNLHYTIFYMEKNIMHDFQICIILRLKISIMRKKQKMCYLYKHVLNCVTIT